MTSASTSSRRRSTAPSRWRRSSHRSRPDPHRPSALVVVDQNADDRVPALLRAHPRLDVLPSARSAGSPARETPRFPLSTPISSRSPTTTASTRPISSPASPQRFATRRRSGRAHGPRRRPGRVGRPVVARRPGRPRPLEPLEPRDLVHALPAPAVVAESGPSTSASGSGRARRGRRARSSTTSCAPSGPARASSTTPTLTVTHARSGTRGPSSGRRAPRRRERRVDAATPRLRRGRPPRDAAPARGRDRSPRSCAATWTRASFHAATLRGRVRGYVGAPSS